MWKSIRDYAYAVWHWWWVMVIGIFGGGVAYALNIVPGLNIPVWVWPLVAVLGIFIAQFLAYRRIANQLIPAELIEETLSRLGELRIEGVNIRNKGLGLKTEDEVSQWINEVNKWHIEVIKEANKISPAEANLLHTVDIIKTKPFENPVNSEHQMYLRVLSDRTENIKKLVQKFTLDNLTRRSRHEN